MILLHTHLAQSGWLCSPRLVPHAMIRCTQRWPTKICALPCALSFDSPVNFTNVCACTGSKSGSRKQHCKGTDELPQPLVVPSQPSAALPPTPLFHATSLAEPLRIQHAPWQQRPRHPRPLAALACHRSHAAPHSVSRHANKASKQWSATVQVTTKARQEQANARMDKRAKETAKMNGKDLASSSASWASRRSFSAIRMAASASCRSRRAMP